MLPNFPTQAEGEAYLRNSENYHKYVNDDSGMGPRMIQVFKNIGWNWDPLPTTQPTQPMPAKVDTTKVAAASAGASGSAPQAEAQALADEDSDEYYDEEEGTDEPLTEDEEKALAEIDAEIERLKPRYQLWQPYNKSKHRQAQFLFGSPKEFEGTRYQAIYYGSEKNDWFAQFFQKHGRYPAGVTVIGEGPEKAYWPKKDYTTRRASDIEPEELVWLWSNRVAEGAICTFAGDPENGKSLLTLYVAACVTRGWTLYGDSKPTLKGDVLVLQAEDDPSKTLVPRMIAAGADLDRMILLESVAVTNHLGQTLGERLVQLDQDLKRIESELKENPDIRLIVIDPISTFLGDAGMNKEQEVRRVLTPLKNLANERNVTVLLVAHFNKSTEARTAMDRVGGAKALVGLARSSWTCVREPKDDAQVAPEGQIEQGEVFLFLKLKNNLASFTKTNGLKYTIRTKQVLVKTKDGDQKMTEHPYIQFLADKVETTAHDAVIDGKRGAGRPRKSEAAEEWLNKYLVSTNGYDTVNRIYSRGEDEGYSERTLQRACENIGLVGRWIGGIKHWGFPANLPPPDAQESRGDHGGARPGAGRKRRNIVDLNNDPSDG